MPIMNQDICFRSIGRVINQYNESTKPEIIRAADSTIVLDPDLTEGLNGLESGQQIMVIFYFDRSEGYELMGHPRGDTSRPRRGVFSLRSPRRPNPIGVTVVELVSIEGNVLQVRGLDALNDTPVLDIKPA